MKKKSPVRALVIALLLFGGLMYVMNPAYREDPQPFVEGDMPEHPYKVQVELRGILEGLAFDHVVVGDTLAQFAAAALPPGKDLEARWSMNYCCAEEEENPEVFQWWGECGFSERSDRMELLKGLAQSGALQLEYTDYENGTLVGVAQAKLPVPGQEGVLELASVAFNFRTVFG